MKKGDLVKVYFVDHSYFADACEKKPPKLLKCTLIGEVTFLNKKRVVIRSWASNSAQADDVYILIRSAIRRVEFLTLKKR